METRATGGMNPLQKEEMIRERSSGKKVVQTRYGNRDRGGRQQHFKNATHSLHAYILMMAKYTRQVKCIFTIRGSVCINNNRPRLYSALQIDVSLAISTQLISYIHAVSTIPKCERMYITLVNIARVVRIFIIGIICGPFRLVQKKSGTLDHFFLVEQLNDYQFTFILFISNVFA